jgi:hypothetical protein
MFKPSLATRVISFAVLIAFLLSSLPVPVAAATDNNRGLEAKWAKLMVLYHRHSTLHNNAPRWVALWLREHKDASERKKDRVQKDLASSNAAWAPVPSIALRHNGFDAQGNVIDKAAARESVKDLSKALQRYKASLKKLKAILRQYSDEG